MNLAGHRVFASLSLRVIKLSWKTWDVFHLLGWTPGTLQHAVVYFWHVLEQWVKTPFHFGWQYICCQVCNEGTCKTRRPRPNSFIDFRTKIWFSAKKNSRVFSWLSVWQRPCRLPRNLYQVQPTRSVKKWPANFHAPISDLSMHCKGAAQPGNHVQPCTTFIVTVSPIPFLPLSYQKIQRCKGLTSAAPNWHQAAVQRSAPNHSFVH